MARAETAIKQYDRYRAIPTKKENILFANKNKIKENIIKNKIAENTVNIEKMRRKVDWIIFGLVTTVGVILMIGASKLAETQRGYDAIGGEILILPLLHILFYGMPVMIRDVKNWLNECMESEDEDEAK